MGAENESLVVIVSERAADMLVDHVRFVAEHSEQAADNLRKKIMEAATSLMHLPERHPLLRVESMVPEHKYRKMVIDKRYLLLYQIKGNCVYVDYVVDCRQDYRWLL